MKSVVQQLIPLLAKDTGGEASSSKKKLPVKNTGMKRKSGISPAKTVLKSRLSHSDSGVNRAEVLGFAVEALKRHTPSGSHCLADELEEDEHKHD